MLARSVLSMEILLLGFALLLAKDLASREGLWLGLALVVLAILALGTLKSKIGWILGWILQFGIILYGFYIFSMFFMGALFLSLWVGAIVIGRKGEALKRLARGKIHNRLGSVMTSQKEQTLVLIKPDGVRRGLIGEIIRRIEAKGYVVENLKMSHVSINQLKKSLSRT